MGWRLQDGLSPYTTLTFAQCLDGSLGSRGGGAIKISSDESMAMTHALRAMHDCIMVGVGTILADDPKLTVRMVTGTDPRPCILDPDVM